MESGIEGIALPVAIRHILFVDVKKDILMERLE